VELFEQILERVDWQDLLCSTRVCKQWRKIILSSKPLQHQLFLMIGEAAPGDEESE